MEKIFIFNSFIAKKLLHNGNKIIDLQKNYKLENATIFVFEKTDKLLSDLEEISKK